MGNKSVCLDCRIAFSYGMDYDNNISRMCPHCKNEMINVNYKFTAPKKGDIKKWETIKYLFENGFYFQHIYNENGGWVKYPQNIKDAKIFVEKYSLQKIIGRYELKNDEMY
jgi:phage pi2 protein 07